MPTTTEKLLQLVPNWYDSTMPETTPMANDTAKILVQKRARRWRCSRPVNRQRTSSVAMKAASPMVKLGKMMWKVIVKRELDPGQQNGV